MTDQDNWSRFWESGVAGPGCLPQSALVLAAFDRLWADHALRLGDEARILDIGCGSGFVGQALVRANPRLKVVGIDYAQVPPSPDPRVELRPGVRAEALGMDDASLDGAVSQFGIEYCDVPRASAELGRTLRPGAPIAFLVHHSASPVVTHNERRSAALGAIASGNVGPAFVAGDRTSLAAALNALRKEHPDQQVVEEFSAGLGSAIGGDSSSRRMQWDGLREMLSSEIAILDALRHAAVGDVESWLDGFGDAFEWQQPETVGGDGGPVAWLVRGARRR